MDALLTLGKADNGELVNVTTQRSGKGSLVCPFCDVPLIAVRGVVKAHHFRHDGDTCRESLGALPLIPGWDHFHLSLPSDLVAELQHHDGKRFVGSDFRLSSRLRDLELIETNDFTGHTELTTTGQVVTGTLSLSKFSKWFRERLQARIDEKHNLVKRGQIHPAHFEIEAWRQQQILSTSLYLFELTTVDGHVFHKIGRTSRSVQTRLAEVVRDMTIARNIAVKGRVLRTVSGAGYVEKFTLWKHRALKFDIDQYQEYLVLDPATLRNLKSDLTRFEGSREELTKAERFIASGRWRYESRRLDAVKEGIARTVRNGLRFGRPVGTRKTGTDEYFQSHQEIVLSLQAGRSVEECARRTYKSLSTVKRVKKALLERGMLQVPPGL